MTPVTVPPSTSYWDSAEAKKLFGTLETEGSARISVLNQIHLLSKSLDSHDGYLTVIAQSDVLDDGEVSNYHIWQIRNKITLLIIALTTALSEMDKIQNWDRCCALAVAKAQQTPGARTITSSRTVAFYYREFRANGRKFLNIWIRTDSALSLPPFLCDNPDICQKVKAYMREKLASLSIELVFDYFHDIILPKLVKERYKIDKKSKLYEEKEQMLLAEYGLKKLSLITVYRYMIILGMRYKTRRKGYYVNGHERPATIIYRNKFVKRYLQREQDMFRWIQISKKESIEFETKGYIPIDSGYKFINDEGIKMVEYHVDSHEKFQERMNEETSYGGQLSVRKSKDSRPLITFGHDECIFKQYLVTHKSWCTKDGATVLVPKDDGQGVMISAFQSREFGFGMDLTIEQVNKVNAFRKGKTYVDEAAAQKRLGSPLKPPLKNNNPFYVELEYGANNEGYWNYELMVLQLEDCTDVVTTLYPDFDFLFLFDHSCGHDKQREDGLNAHNMIKGFGGKQRKMRHTIIKQEEGYLGPYPRTLNVGDTQKMVFTEDDVGPWWMSQTERTNRKIDQVTHKHKPKNKAELIAALKEMHIELPPNTSLKQVQKKCSDVTIPLKHPPTPVIIEKSKNKAELIEALKEQLGVDLPPGTRIKEVHKKCLDANIPLKHPPTPVISEGWCGKAKGMMQVLWERGFIDKSKKNEYILAGSKDEFGVVDKNTSLKYLLENLSDFVEEESLLQTNARKMGAQIDRTPKCHAELAGEGIEYTWGFGKNHFRRQPLDLKRKKETFRGLVRSSLSRQKCTPKIIRSFSKRARDYIVSYHLLTSKKSEIKNNVIEDIKEDEPVVVKVEKMKKLFKTHRCAMDFDSKFINSAVNSSFIDLTKDDD